MHLGPILRSLLRSKARAILAIGMTALTFAIVVNCLQMILAARAETQKRSGFDEENLVSVLTTPYDRRFEDDDYMRQVIREDMALLRVQPGVVAVTQTHLRPWIGGGSSWESKPDGSEAGFQRMQIYPGGPDLARTLGVEIVEGRAFTEEEVDTGGDNSPSVILSKALADLYWPDESAVGKVLEFPDPEYRPVVVGVIDPFYNPYGWPIEEYVVFQARYRGSYDWGFRYLVRLESEAMANVAFLEEVLASKGDGRIITSSTVPEHRQRYFAQKQALIDSLGLIIVLMVIVTSIGIFGMTYFNVAHRTKQIGTRRALGATRRDILAHFLTENGVVSCAGLAIGLCLALGLNIMLVSEAGAARLGVPILIAGGVAIALVSLLAALVPAARGTRVAPVVATRL